ncbi:MAG: hypothetical protein MUF71_09160 [Candidatus Kapabacteria bacterium]|jgi:hypothetical protein|nr:hypothetical protein [Candidatus Kapabacteria bacterium]
MNTQNLNQDDLAAEYREPDMMPPPKRKNWLIVYGLIGILGITGLTLIILYRQVPKKSAPVAKRTVPATRTVFTSVLGTVDSATARHIVDDVSRSIGADSAVTNMIVSGTAVYKRCTSLKDFQNLFLQALLSAEPENLKRQSLLLSHVAGVIQSDVLPTQLFIIGRIGEDEFTPQEKRLIGFAKVLGARNESVGRVSLITYIPPANTSNGEALNGGASSRDKFLTTLKYGKYTVTEHPLQWQ